MAAGVNCASNLPVFSFGGHAHTFEQVGLEHGIHAKERIQGFLITEFAQEMRMMRDGDARTLFEQMRHRHLTTFPDYAAEIEGIAKGAEVALDDVWMLNLMDLFVGLEVTATQKCSDVHAHCSTFASIYDSELILGHTEDWSEADAFLDTLYLQDVVYPGGTHLSGFGYPGQILGAAIVGNSHGLFFTANSVFPKQVCDGLGLIFVGRWAMEEKSIASAIDRLRERPLAWGLSVNIVSFPDFVGANVEVSHSTSDVQWISTPNKHFNHFNHFCRLPDANGMVGQSSHDRNETQRVLGPPQNAAELEARLCYRGDGNQKVDAIYRPNTMMTWLIRCSKDGSVKVFIWNRKPADSGEPSLVWSPSQGFH